MQVHETQSDIRSGGGGGGGDCGRHGERERAENVGRHKHHCQARHRTEMGNRPGIRTYVETGVERENNFLALFALGFWDYDDEAKTVCSCTRKNEGG